MNDVADREERVAVWDRGRQLSTSWLHYGDPGQIEQQIDRRGSAQASVIERLIMGDVFGLLASGELIAFGYCVEPKLSDGPVRVPADVFERCDDTLWPDDRASASGWVYERIRVLPASEYQPSRPQDGQEAAAQGVLVCANEKRTGRPSNARLLAQAIARLNLDPQFSNSPLDDKIDAVRKEARALDADRFTRESQPSRSSIIDALNLAGLTIASRESKKSKNT